MQKDIRNIKFYKYYQDWVDTYKVGQIRKVTLDKYYTTAKEIKELAPDLVLGDITRGDVQRLVNRFGLTRELPTVKGFLNHLEAPLRDAVYEGWLKRDPTYKVRATSQVQPHSTRKKYIQPRQVEALVKVMKASGDVAGIMFDFYLQTGLRFAKLLGLTPRDVNFDDMTVNINKSWDYKDAKMHFQPCKNKFSNRILVIDPLAADDLKQVMAGCPKDDPIFVRALSNERTKGAKYHDDYGNKYVRIYDCTLNRQLYRYCKKAGVPRITIHSLRHIHGSLLISHGVSIESVSKRLGHANTITTQRTYIHLLEDLKTKDDHKMIRILSELEGQPDKLVDNGQEAQTA